jgi:hypothetical protein
MSSIGDEEFPNQFLGMENVQSTNAGASNKITAPLKLDTGVLLGGTADVGAMLQSGSGVPTVGSPAGGYYLRTDTPSTPNQRLYVCTVAGVAGAATWVGIL